MIFPIETIAMKNGCIAQEQRIKGGRIPKRNVGVPRINCRPQITYKGHHWTSARLSYHLNISCIDVTPNLKSNQLVLHNCDNEWCINPNHLRLGTQTENMKDVVERNSSWRESRKNCQNEESLKKMSDANHRRKGEKRPNHYWKTEEGIKKQKEISKIAIEKGLEKRINSIKAYWKSEEGIKKALEFSRMYKNDIINTKENSIA